MFVVAAAAVAILVLPTSAAVTKAASPKARADAKLGHALSRLVTMRGGPPGIVSVVKRGAHRKVFKRGVADRASSRRISLGDRWRIASVAKAFSGAVALRLVALGRLSLDDTIAERLPNLPTAWGSVTLAQALQHTSGLPDYAASPGFARQGTKHPRAPVAPSTLLGYVADKPLDFAPGARYHYSDTDNIVVALFVEEATQLSYERELDALVIDPLRLRRTSMPTGYRMPAPYVRGYANNARGRRPDVSEMLNPTLAWASGGIVSSPLDLSRFIRAYTGGDLFGGATRAAQLHFRRGESVPRGPGVNGSGLGLYRYRTRCGTVYGHTGNVPGYTTFIAASRSGRRSVTLQVSTQLTPDAGVPRTWRALRRAFGLGVCAALAHAKG
jgi:D-alanyl-D-alanine carboxypeptidase